jgi:hypothetical protein
MSSRRSFEGGSVVIRAGQIEPAPWIGAEELALALFQAPAAVGAGAHDVFGTGGRGVEGWMRGRVRSLAHFFMISRMAFAMASAAQR